MKRKKMNGKPQHPGSQQQQQPLPTYALIQVYTDDGDYNHTYAKHSVQLGGGDGGSVLMVQETKGEQLMSIYPLNRVKRTVLTPSALELN